MSRRSARSIFAEALGSALLLAIIVGSGVMGERLAGGNAAIALLANSLATSAGLATLILIFRPASGAHFNPAVTAAFLLQGGIGPGLAAAYVAAQLSGAVAGVLLAHAMFDLELLQASTRPRLGLGQGIGEATATFGLVLTVLQLARRRPDCVAFAVGLFILSAYWFTSSTSFANPAVTVARMATDTFVGIRPADAPLFVVAELSGAGLALLALRALFADERSGP
jgi:glycerol uptake facilitator-like aquaporin